MHVWACMQGSSCCSMGAFLCSSVRFATPCCSRALVLLRALEELVELLSRRQLERERAAANARAAELHPPGMPMPKGRHPLNDRVTRPTISHGHAKTKIARVSVPVPGVTFDEPDWCGDSAERFGMRRAMALIRLHPFSSGASSDALCDDVRHCTRVAMRQGFTKQWRMPSMICPVATTLYASPSIQHYMHLPLFNTLCISLYSTPYASPSIKRSIQRSLFITSRLIRTWRSEMMESSTCPRRGGDFLGIFNAVIF